MRDTFKSIGVENIICRNEITSKLVASYIFEPDAAVFTESLMSTSVSENDYDIIEYKVNEANPYNGSNFIESFIKLKSNLLLIDVLFR